MIKFCDHFVNVLRHFHKRKQEEEEEKTRVKMDILLEKHIYIYLCKRRGLLEYEDK